MQKLTGEINVHTDSDWGGDQVTRRSTSGGLLMFEKCLIKSWAKLQGMVSLSSAEAEYLAMMKGVREALALRTMLLEMGIKTEVTIFVDSSAAKASMEKPGLMHMKHMQIRFLWIQQLRSEAQLLLTHGSYGRTFSCRLGSEEEC